MLIGCTKKLQEEMGIIAQSWKGDNDFYSWSAHVITVSRRKTMVVVNDSSRFGFVLYGLKAKDFKRIDELIQDGIRKCLQDERFKEEIIEQYLREAGPICFGKTKGPRYVSRLNKACEFVGFSQELLDTSNIFQSKVTRKINEDLIKVSKSDYDEPYERVMQDFKKTYGDSIVECEAAQLLVKLDLGAYIAQRRIITPLDICFNELHEIIQSMFNWKDYHLHEFNVFNEKGQQIIKAVIDFEELSELHFQECRIVIDSEVGIKEYMKDNYKIDYLYDLGDGWNHEIIVEDIVSDYDKNYVICTEGTGDGPPEDVGGVPGYREFLKIMADPTHSEYKEMKRWADGQWYREFDIDLVNRRLRSALRK